MVDLTLLRPRVRTPVLPLPRLRWHQLSCEQREQFFVRFLGES